MNEERLIELESKIAFLEDATQELNKTVYQQQKKLDRLEAICESLVQHIVDLRENLADRAVVDEKPPHY